MLIRVLWRIAALAVALTLVVPLLPASTAEAQSRPYADPAFERIWKRYDQPVEQNLTRRSWTWGPNTPYNGPEPYKQGRDGRRLVQYFDKARMEINDPSKEADDPFFVTNGLLVRELVSGKIATGDKPEDFEQRTPSDEAVAGDPSNVNDNAATYATFFEIASLDANRPSESRIGQRVTETVDKQGRIRTLPSEDASLGDLVRISVFNPILRHNIPDKFWDFLNQKGLVFQGGRNVPDTTVFQPWDFAMGVPMTEPYWTRTKVSGTERWVLVQLFERRVLTYTPTNPPGFEVEMGNVGQHYYRWRYQISQDPGDTSRPRITSGPQRVAGTATTMRIQWSTNVRTTSEIWYGKDRSYPWKAGSATEYTIDHSVDIGSLEPNTLYYWRVVSRDSSGRIVDDTDHTYRTPAS